MKLPAQMENLICTCKERGERERDEEKERDRGRERLREQRSYSNEVPNLIFHIRSIDVHRYKS